MYLLQNIKTFLQQVYQKNNLINDYKNKIKSAFPGYLEADLEKVLDIIPFNSYGLPNTVENGINGEFTEIKLTTSKLTFFIDRIYFQEPSPELENGLTETQKHIINCIYTRHHNGYVREKRLQKLIGIDHEWILIYKLQLLGEYVIEILFELDKHITNENIHLYKQLTLNNRKYWVQTKSRIISYWNEYYRYPSYKNVKDYIGYKIMIRINKVNH